MKLSYIIKYETIFSPKVLTVYTAKDLPQNGILNFASTFIAKHKIV